MLRSTRGKWLPLGIRAVKPAGGGWVLCCSRGRRARELLQLLLASPSPSSSMRNLERDLVASRAHDDRRSLPSEAVPSSILARISRKSIATYEDSLSEWQLMLGPKAIPLETIT